MKQRMVIGVVMVAVTLSSGCKCETQPEAFLEEESSRLVGPYLGQEPPGGESYLRVTERLSSFLAERLTATPGPGTESLYLTGRRRDLFLRHGRCVQPENHHGDSSRRLGLVDAP